MDKIICLGKNYLEHALELGDSVPKKPVIFLKPPSVLKTVKRNESVNLFFPDNRGSLHHELEVVIKLKHGGVNLSEAQAAQAIEAVSLGLDMTLRDEQNILKKQGHPWTTSKVFPDSAVIGPWINIEDFVDWESQVFSLKVNNILRQHGKISEALFSPIQAIAYASQFFEICAGDILFTGTPAGVNSITRGDTATLEWNNYNYSATWK